MILPIINKRLRYCVYNNNNNNDDGDDCDNNNDVDYVSYVYVNLFVLGNGNIPKNVYKIKKTKAWLISLAQQF